MTSTKRPTPHPFLAIPGLPESARPLVARLLDEAALPVATLVDSVAGYRNLIIDVAHDLGRADARLGTAIADALQALLAHVDERTGPEALRVIQTAVRYFVIEDDGFGNDLDDEDGLFGDARVVNAMLRWFGRDDLLVPLPEPAIERRPLPEWPRRVVSATH